MLALTFGDVSEGLVVMGLASTSDPEAVGLCVYVRLSQVVVAADMLGLEGLKDVAEMVLTRNYCRFFPKVSDLTYTHSLSQFSVSYSHTHTHTHTHTNTYANI